MRSHVLCERSLALKSIVSWIQSHVFESITRLCHARDHSPLILAGLPPTISPARNRHDSQVRPVLSCLSRTVYKTICESIRIGSVSTTCLIVCVPNDNIIVIRPKLIVSKQTTSHGYLHETIDANAKRRRQLKRKLQHQHQHKRADCMLRIITPNISFMSSENRNCVLSGMHFGKQGGLADDTIEQHGVCFAFFFVSRLFL